MQRRSISLSKIRKDHARLCFTRAFPGSRAEHGQALNALIDLEREIGSLAKSQRNKLDESGITDTHIRYPFSFEVAQWLAKTSPGAVSIDWPAVDSHEQLDDLLRHILQPGEDEYFDSGYATAKDWIKLASSGFKGTDFDWLMAQLRDKPRHQFWQHLYDAAELPLIWYLHDSKYSKSRNVFAVSAINTRENGMRQRPRNVKREIQRPLKSISRLSKRQGAALIDVAMASLAVRHRETYHFNFANPDEVYMADVGDGVNIAVFGLVAEHRFPLECTMGYLMLANGMPIGYGGSSIVFKQLNTGINIFDEYRGSEASYLWVQILRVYHSLVGSTRIIANPYQLGKDNPEALKSGAFWFYYQLGFRPVSSDLRNIAIEEIAKKIRNPAYRTSTKTLRKLADGDMHLTLPGARRKDYFDEEWIKTSSMLATEVLGGVGGKSWKNAADLVMRSVADDVGIRSLDAWTHAEKKAFLALAPIIAVAKPRAWSVSSKRVLRQLLKAKGGKQELPYARKLCAESELLASLGTVCKRAG